MTFSIISGRNSIHLLLEAQFCNRLCNEYALMSPQANVVSIVKPFVSIVKTNIVMWCWYGVIGGIWLYFCGKKCSYRNQQYNKIFLDVNMVSNSGRKISDVFVIIKMALTYYWKYLYGIIICILSLFWYWS